MVRKEAADQHQSAARFAGLDLDDVGGHDGRAEGVFRGARVV